MSRDDIIEMGVEAGLPAFIYPDLINERDWVTIERFADLVSKLERHSCAKVAWDYGWRRVDNEDVQAAAVEIHDAIRARSKE